MVNVHIPYAYVHEELPGKDNLSSLSFSSIKGLQHYVQESRMVKDKSAKCHIYYRMKRRIMISGWYWFKTSDQYMYTLQIMWSLTNKSQLLQSSVIKYLNYRKLIKKERKEEWKTLKGSQIILCVAIVESIVYFIIFFSFCYHHIWDW